MPSKPPAYAKTRASFWFDVSGPLFTNDVGKRLIENMGDVVERVSWEGWQRAQELAPVKSGALLAHLNMRQESNIGRTWLATQVISTWGLGEDAWPNGPFGGFFQYAGRAEAKWHFMRAGRQAILTASKGDADLTKGLT